MTEIDQAAIVIWNYMRMNQPLRHCDAIFALGSRDDRTATYAATLFTEGYGDWLIVSGGVTWKERGDTETEAEHFARLAREAGVPQDRIIVENQAMNTGQNVTLAYKLLQTLGHHFTSFLLVQKPYMERRTYATFRKQWPDATADITVTSVPLPFQEYCGYDQLNSKEQVIHIMVGDLQRIVEYPKLGFQIPQNVPDDVMRAWQTLVDAGYTRHLIKR